MKKYKLDKEEQEILDAFESGKLESNMTSHRKKFIKDSAAQTFKKDKRINITMDWTGPTPNPSNPYHITDRRSQTLRHSGST